jgi:hypothetical protein
MNGGTREKRLALAALLAVLLGDPARPVRGEASGFPREANPRILATIRKASARLADPRCQQVFSDFRDREGHTLQEKLASLGSTGQEYLEQIQFYESSRNANCEWSQVLATTSPGSHVVYLCGLKLAKWTLRDPDYAVAVIIHEELHSLGLGEDPPSSEEITYQVNVRCAK